MSETRPSQTLHVRFSDACTDVLLHLAGQKPTTWRTAYGIASAIAPPGVDEPTETVQNALTTLHECGLVEARVTEGWRVWRLTHEGQALVAAHEKDSLRCCDLPPHMHPEGCTEEPA